MWEVSEDEDHMGSLAVLLAAWVLCLGPPAAAVAQGGPQATAHSLLDGMPLLAASKPHALVADLRKEIVQLLAHVIPEAEIDDWLRDLTDGRFSIPQPEGGAAPPASPKDGALV